MKGSRLGPDPTKEIDGYHQEMAKTQQVVEK